MGLLDKELISIKSEYTKKPEWALCKFCRVPFLTSTFSDSCERCSHFVQYKIEFSSKIMLSYIIVSIIANLSIIGVIFILFKFTKNYSLILLISTLFNTIQGCILWKTVKKIMNN
jgi:hypothetical protein